MEGRTPHASFSSPYRAELLTFVMPIQLLIDGTEEITNSSAVLNLAGFKELSVREQGLLSLSEAAEILNVSRGRAHQLATLGTLQVWKFLGRPFVSATQVEARLRAGIDKRGGRPKGSGKGKPWTEAQIAAREKRAA